MSDQGKANYTAVAAKLGGQGDYYDALPPDIQAAYDAGADAVEQWLADAPVDEDAPGSEPQPATTVIVVVEAPVGDLRPVERRYGARGWEDFDDGRLHVFDRKARRVAVYASGAWLSVREDGALVADATKRALDIARHTLNEICRTNVTETNEDGTIHKGVAVLRELARQGLEGIFDEEFE